MPSTNRHSWASAAVALAALAALIAPARAGQVALEPVQDNVLFSENQNSNGAGSSLFCGTTALGAHRRSLLRFDVAANVPAGAVITGVELRLHLTNTIAGNRLCTLHRASASWGEGTSNSDPLSGGGGGAPPTAGDATWGFRFHATTPWTSTGGDFAATPSAGTLVGSLFQSYAWTSAQLAADVQGWLDAPSTNHGWILIGDQSATVTAKRFGSREHATPSFRPELVIDYAVALPRFCDASDGSLAACPCANPGAADTGCDIPQATGGVRLDLVAQTTAPNAATLQGVGFPTSAMPTAVVIRSSALDPGAPVVFGDGLRCISTTSLVRLASVSAGGGVSTHVIPHGAPAGPGSFHYQIWFRSTPSTFCDPLAAFNLSGGVTLAW